MPIEEAIIVQVILRQRLQLLAYARTIVRDSHKAEDVLQEVTMLALKKKNELNEVTALPSWLRRTTRFQSLAAIRDQSRENTDSLSPEVLDKLDAFWEENEPKNKRRIELLDECVSQLTTNSQEIIALRYMKGMRGKDVAEKLGRKVRTVYMALTRIHSTLRECVERKLTLEEDK